MIEDVKADTQAISISAHPSTVFAFVADPANLPRWAIGFARAIRPDGGRWLVRTATAEVPLEVRSDRDTGVVDFLFRPAPGVVGVAASRVLPRGDGAEYVFTQFRAPGTPDPDFARSVAAVSHELTVLKAVLETECPL